MTTLWNRAQYDAATAYDAARRARDDARRARIADAIRARGEITGDAAINAAAAATAAAWDAASFDFDAGRTMVYDAYTACKTPTPPQTDPWADTHGAGPRPWTPEDDAVSPTAATAAAVSGLLQAGRGNTPTTPLLETPNKTLLQTLIDSHGVEVAFQIWAQRRTPTPCRPELWDAQRVLADAKEAEKDAIASLAEARLARRAAAATLAEARAQVAVERARIARARV